MKWYSPIHVDELKQFPDHAMFLCFLSSGRLRLTSVNIIEALHQLHIAADFIPGQGITTGVCSMCSHFTAGLALSFVAGEAHEQLSSNVRTHETETSQHGPSTFSTFQNAQQLHDVRI